MIINKWPGICIQTALKISEINRLCIFWNFSWLTRRTSFLSNGKGLTFWWLEMSSAVWSCVLSGKAICGLVCRWVPGWSWGRQSSPFLQNLTLHNCLGRGMKISETAAPWIHWRGTAAEEGQRPEPGRSQYDNPEFLQKEKLYFMGGQQPWSTVCVWVPAYPGRGINRKAEKSGTWPDSVILHALLDHVLPFGRWVWWLQVGASYL